MAPCFKHVICHTKFSCPVGVVAEAVAVAAVEVALVVAVVEVLVIHAFIQPRVTKCLEILVLMA